jgi:hypothetical protein
MATHGTLRGSLIFAKKRQFAWKTTLLAAVSLGLGVVVLSKEAVVAQLYLGLLVAVHVAGLAMFAIKVDRRDIAPSRFGLLWRATGLAVMLALLTLIRLQPDSAVFWPSLGAIWAIHTAGLSVLHLRAVEGAPCPFLPSTWKRAES